MSRDPRRMFTTFQRTQIFLAANGACQGCGEGLGPGWEADHVISWAEGGPTEVENGQALCPRCHRSKPGPAKRRPARPRPTTGVAGRFIRLRKEVGISQLALAYRSGVSHGSITALERGSSVNPRVRTVMALAETLGVPVGELIERVFKEEGEQAEAS